MSFQNVKQPRRGINNVLILLFAGIAAIALAVTLFLTGAMNHIAPSKEMTNFEGERGAGKMPPMPQLFGKFTKEFKPVEVLGRSLRPLGIQPTISVAEAQKAKKLNPRELVIAVTVNSETRAYPINMLTNPDREIFNDKLGGRAIAATW